MARDYICDWLDAYPHATLDELMNHINSNPLLIDRVIINKATCLDDPRVPNTRTFEFQICYTELTGAQSTWDCTKSVYTNRYFDLDMPDEQTPEMPSLVIEDVRLGAEIRPCDRYDRCYTCAGQADHRIVSPSHPHPGLPTCTRCARDHHGAQV